MSKQASFDEELTRLESALEAEKKKRRKLQVENDRLRELVDDLRTDLNELTTRVHKVEQTYDGLAGLAEDQCSTPEARKRDLVLALERQASASDGTAHMDYKDVKKALKTLNHGKIYDQQAYRAMEAAAEDVDGVSEGTFDGKQVVRIDLDKFSGGVGVDG